MTVWNRDLQELLEFQQKNISNGNEVKQIAKMMANCIDAAEGLLKDSVSRNILEKTRNIVGYINSTGDHFCDEMERCKADTMDKIERFEQL